MYRIYVMSDTGQSYLATDETYANIQSAVQMAKTLHCLDWPPNQYLTILNTENNRPAGYTAHVDGCVEIRPC